MRVSAALSHAVLNEPPAGKPHCSHAARAARDSNRAQLHALPFYTHARTHARTHALRTFCARTHARTSRICFFCLSGQCCALCIERPVHSSTCISHYRPQQAPLEAPPSRKACLDACPPSSHARPRPSSLAPPRCHAPGKKGARTHRRASRRYHTSLAARGPPGHHRLGRSRSARIAPASAWPPQLTRQCPPVAALPPS